VTIGAKFGVVAVIGGAPSLRGGYFPSDDIYEDGRHPSQVYFSSAKEDVFRRDFTVNGLLMDPRTNEIVDYVMAALILKKIIRTIVIPTAALMKTSLRMLRAVRFAANLGFDVDPATQNAIEKRGGR